jgi:hypothetical protein
MDLYMQENLNISNTEEIKSYVAVGQLTNIWSHRVQLSAEICLYLHLLRVLVDFLIRNDAIKKPLSTYAVWASAVKVYLCVAFLIFALHKV